MLMNLASVYLSILHAVHSHYRCRNIFSIILNSCTLFKITIEYFASIECVHRSNYSCSRTANAFRSWYVDCLSEFNVGLELQSSLLPTVLDSSYGLSRGTPSPYTIGSKITLALELICVKKLFL